MMLTGAACRPSSTKGRRLTSGSPRGRSRRRRRCDRRSSPSSQTATEQDVAVPRRPTLNVGRRRTMRRRTRRSRGRQRAGGVESMFTSGGVTSIAPRVRGRVADVREVVGRAHRRRCGGPQASRRTLSPSSTAATRRRRACTRRSSRAPWLEGEQAEVLLETIAGPGVDRRVGAVGVDEGLHALVAGVGDEHRPVASIATPAGRSNCPMSGRRSRTSR